MTAPKLRPWFLAGALLLLAVLAWATLSGAVRQLPRAQTTGQQLETALQAASGVLALLCMATAFRAVRGARALRTAWAASLAAAAGLSALVWGPPDPLVAAIFAAAALLVALAVIRLLRSGQA